MGGHFNPLPPHGGRLGILDVPLLHRYFNPLPPHGGRRLNNSRYFEKKYFNPLPPHGGRQEYRCIRDWMENFNPLPPHGGRPCLSCLSIRCRSHFNPLPPHGGRQLRGLWERNHQDISIHSLRMEGDKMANPKYIPRISFQSTPSAWRETRKRRRCGHCGIFQSTPSAWRETIFKNRVFDPAVFQSTPSAWRETAKLHRKAFFISPILVQSCKKGCKRLHSAPEKMVFFEKREKNLVRNLQHLSVRL